MKSDGNDQRAVARGAEIPRADREREAVPIASSDKGVAKCTEERPARERREGTQRKLSPRLLHRRGNRRAPGDEGSQS